MCLCLSNTHTHTSISQVQRLLVSRVLAAIPTETTGEARALTRDEVTAPPTEEERERFGLYHDSEHDDFPQPPSQPPPPPRHPALPPSSESAPPK